MIFFALIILIVASFNSFILLAATVPVPWFFIVAGIITAILAGLVIWAIVKAAKKRKEDKEAVYDGR